MNKARVFWPLAAVIVLLDFVSKRMAEGSLAHGETRQVLGDWLRFTLGYNPGIAFGLQFGGGARPLLILFTVLAVAGIVWIYRTTEAIHKLQIIALGLIMGGAIGNLIDRLMNVQGVVDFIDVGIGATRFWTFNIADSAITIGAVLLILGSFSTPKDQSES